MRLAGLVVILALGAISLTALASAGLAPVAHATVAPGAAAHADLAVPDPDLALLVGAARGPSLLGIPLGSPAEVFAVAPDAPEDLRGLAPTGRVFDFTDPHGNAWQVAEYEAPWGFAYGTRVGALTLDPDAGAYNFVLLVDHTKVGGTARLVAR